MQNPRDARTHVIRYYIFLPAIPYEIVSIKLKNVTRIFKIPTTKKAVS